YLDVSRFFSQRNRAVHIGDRQPAAAVMYFDVGVHLRNPNVTRSITHGERNSGRHYDFEIDRVFGASPVRERTRNVGCNRDLAGSFARDFDEPFQNAFLPETENPEAVNRYPHAHAGGGGIAADNKFPLLHIKGDAVYTGGRDIHRISFAIGGPG